MFMSCSYLITVFFFFFFFFLAGRVQYHLLHHKSGRLIRRSYHRRFAGEHKSYESQRKRQDKLGRICSTSS